MITIHEYSPIELRENYLKQMRTGRAEDILAAYRQSISRIDKFLELELLGIIKTRTDFQKDDWSALLHGSPNGSELALLARERLKLLD